MPCFGVVGPAKPRPTAATESRPTTEIASAIANTALKRTAWTLPNLGASRRRRIPVTRIGTSAGVVTAGDQAPRRVATFGRNAERIGIDRLFEGTSQGDPLTPRAGCAAAPPLERPGSAGHFAKLAQQLARLVDVRRRLLERLADQLERRARDRVRVLIELALGCHHLD